MSQGSSVSLFHAVAAMIEDVATGSRATRRSNSRLTGVDPRSMEALDACNARFGRGAIAPAAAGLAAKRGWATRFEMRSPRSTARVGELPVAHAQARLNQAKCSPALRSVLPSGPALAVHALVEDGDPVADRGDHERRQNEEQLVGRHDREVPFKTRLAARCSTTAAIR